MLQKTVVCVKPLLSANYFTIKSLNIELIFELGYFMHISCKKRVNSIKESKNGYLKQELAHSH